ncbi:MAG TPA: hypothetical protein VM509_14945 [Planctomycetota bacterium]|nr:hypothetical protein [Planctomycetota bacterium]
MSIELVERPAEAATHAVVTFAKRLALALGRIGRRRTQRRRRAGVVAEKLDEDRARSERSQFLFTSIFKSMTC